MHVEDCPINTIKPYENNPRNNDKAVAAVANSIKQFGFRQPIVVDEKMVIIAGHTRYRAAKRLRLKTVPVHIATGMTPAQIKAYRLADNKLNELAKWDADMLGQELQELVAMEADLSNLGFDDDELSKFAAAGSDGDGEETDKAKVFTGACEVIVQCNDEAHQKKIYDELTARGNRCRLVTI